MPPIKVKGQIAKFDDLQKIMALIPIKELAVTDKFLKGDHWQAGDGWVGYMPNLETTEGAKDWIQIQKAFKPKNVSLGLVKRIVGAVLGKQPDYKVVAKDKDGKVIQKEKDPAKEKIRTKSPEELFFEDLDKKLDVWWTEKEVHEKLKKFVYNKAGFGKAGIRIYIPKGYLNDAGKLETTNLDEILSKIFIEVPDYDCVNDALDKNYGKKLTVVQSKEDEADGGKTVFEVCYIDENNKTCLRQVKENDEDPGQEKPKGLIEMDLGGNLLTYVAGEYSKALISETIKKQQMGLNHAKTGENLAASNINFPDTTFVNADLETEKKYNPNTKKTEDVAKPLFFGPGRWRNIVGQWITDAMGGESRATPTVHFREGADPEKFRKIAENDAMDMHQEAGMGFIYMQSSPYPSGDSRVEAMTDYLILLIDEKTLCDAVGTWLITTVIRLLFHFTKQSDKKDKFTVIYTSKLTMGKMSVEDKRLMLDEVKARVRSRRNYQISAEVTDDPTSEDETIFLEIDTAPKSEDQEAKANERIDAKEALQANLKMNANKPDNPNNPNQK